MSTLNKIKLATLGLLMLFTMGFVSSATATILTITNVTLPSGTPFNLEMTGGFFGGSTKTVSSPYAGQIVLDTVEYGKINTWCVDDIHVIELGGKYKYTTGVLTTDNSGATVAGSNPLNAQQIHDVMALATYGNQLLAGLPLGNDRNIKSGQIQAAIWSIIYGATVTAVGADVGGVSALMFTQGIADLKALAPTLSDGNAVALFNLGPDGIILSQVLITTFVPEPTTLMLLGLGFAGACMRRRRYL